MKSISTTISRIPAWVAVAALVLVALFCLQAYKSHMETPVFSASGIPSDRAGECLDVTGRMPAKYGDDWEAYRAAEPEAANNSLHISYSSCNEVRSK